MKGLVHSIDTFSTLDGPGIRTVIFMQGCHLRCKYCHNPDAWKFNSAQAQELTVDEIMQIIIRNLPYYRSSQGGITFSGGEPLLQYQFVKEVFKRCKNIAVDTAIDSSLYVKTTSLKEVLPYTDLVLADIKQMDKAKSIELTGMDNTLNIANLKVIAKAKVPIWIRYVVVPGLTNDKEDIVKLAHFINNLNGIQRIDLLPYHSLGKHKWDLLGLEYELKNVTPPTSKIMNQISNIIKEITNIPVYF